MTGDFLLLIYVKLDILSSILVNFFLTNINIQTIVQSIYYAYLCSMKKLEIKTKIIDEEIINILFSIEENDLSPCDEPYSDDVYNQFKSDYIGKTIEDY
jgi:hypothetical protein